MLRIWLVLILHHEIEGLQTASARVQEPAPTRKLRLILLVRRRFELASEFVAYRAFDIYLAHFNNT